MGHIGHTGHEDVYTADFWDGIRCCVALVRAGSGPDDIESILPDGEPRNRDEYQTMLARLRTILGTDCPEIYGVTL